MKINKKSIFGLLGASTVIVAPLATIVSCGENNNLKGVDSQLPKPVLTGLEGISSISSNDDGTIPKVDTTKIVPYSVDSLRQDAQAIGGQNSDSPEGDNAL